MSDRSGLKTFLKMLFLCLFIVACTVAPPHLAALPGLPLPHQQSSAPPSPLPSQGSTPPPATPLPQQGTPSPSVSRGAAQEDAPVTLNSSILIRVRADSGHSAAERAVIIERRLEEVLKRAKAAPSVDIATVDQTPVIESEGIYLISVTNSDAAALEISVGAIAATWRDDLEKGLRRSWHERSEGYTREALIWSLIAISTGIILTIIGIFIFQRFFKMPGFLLTFIIWLSVIAIVLWLFPESRPWSGNLIHNVLMPLALFLVTLIIVMFMLKPTDSFVNRFFDIYEKIREKDLDQSGRGQRRLTMLRVVAKVIARIALVIIATLLFLNSLNINITAAITGAGIIGVGLGIVSQDLLKDYLTGFCFVFEDQFAVGDVIKTAGLSGTVEDFTLRITRLRDMEGRLISIPNSSIRTVENLSSGWSQVDCSVLVAYRTDLARAIELIIDVARELRGQWQDLIIADPEMLGVEALDDSGVRLRMVMKTTPLSQWKVKRELLLRIKSRFDREGIEIPIPQQSVWLHADEGQAAQAASADPESAGRQA
jgi:small-conductance mechanosensitive channel